MLSKTEMVYDCKAIPHIDVDTWVSTLNNRVDIQSPPLLLLFSLPPSWSLYCPDPILCNVRYLINTIVQHKPQGKNAVFVSCLLQFLCIIIYTNGNKIFLCCFFVFVWLILLVYISTGLQYVTLSVPTSLEKYLTTFAPQSILGVGG